MSKATINALINRGIDTALANNLANAKYTLAKLKMMSEEELITLGVSKEQVSILFSEKRPPIPNDISNRVLYRNRYTCCVCRNSQKSVILHHIKEWSISRDHSEKNLAVLCLEHHNDAHTTKGLAISLSSDRVQECKKFWEKDCETKDIIEIFRLKDLSNQASWGWINIRRLFEMFFQKKLSITSKNFNINTFSILKSNGFLDHNNILISDEKWPISLEKKRWYFNDFYEGMYIADYLNSLLEMTLKTTPIIDITKNIREKSWLRSMVDIDSFICLQAAFYFRDIEKSENNRTNIREAYYQAHGIKIKYTYESWYCLSSSARFCWMSGHVTQTIIGRVRSIIDEDGELIINISCIAAGSYFMEHSARKQHSYIL